MRFKITAITRSQPRSYLVVLADGQTGKIATEGVTLRLRPGDTGEFWTDERGRQRMRLDAIDADEVMDYSIGS